MTRSLVIIVAKLSDLKNGQLGPYNNPEIREIFERSAIKEYKQSGDITGLANFVGYGNTLSKETSELIAALLRKHVRKKAGPPRSESLKEKRRFVYLYVLATMDEIKEQHKANGTSKKTVIFDEACELVSDVLKIPSDTIKKYYYEHKKR